MALSGGYAISVPFGFGMGFAQRAGRHGGGSLRSNGAEPQRRFQEFVSMAPRFLTDRATDCTGGSTDWTTIGARILAAAAIASAIHARESTRLGPRETLREKQPAANREQTTGRLEAGRLRG